MFKKLIYFVITAVLILSSLQISAFAKDTTITIKAGQVFNLFDYLKDVGDKLTVIYSEDNSKIVFQVVSKSTDEKGDYILCNITNKDGTSQQKFYLPYI
ncbi:hypothetical protein HKI81_11175, partial [Caldanaerobacter subterraneus]|nr:hypothetical protein [Caldanaerobacter subterraneus]